MLGHQRAAVASLLRRQTASRVSAADAELAHFMLSFIKPLRIYFLLDAFILIEEIRQMMTLWL
jgi:hypothetical protein